MTKIGSTINKTIGLSISNSGDKDITITKLIAKDPDTNEIILTSTDASVLGVLKSNENKALSITLKKDIWLKFELTYTIGETEYQYIAEKYLVLTISSNEYGKCQFAGMSAGKTSKSFSVEPSSQATVTLIPEDECIFSKLTVNKADVTEDVTDNNYTISNITSNTTVVALFESTSAEHPTIDGHEYVDLGLSSGSLWSVTNYGANEAEEYGSYCSSNTTFSYWGENWLMPTKENFQELIDECTWTWTTLNEINGYSITGPNGKTLFLPAAGYGSRILGASNVGKNLNYFTSSSDIVNRWCLIANNSEYNLKSSYVFDDYSIRPIAKKKSNSTDISGIMANGNSTVKVYNLSGIETTFAKKGIVIIKTEDGKAKKYIVK